MKSYSKVVWFFIFVLIHNWWSIIKWLCIFVSILARFWQCLYLYLATKVSGISNITLHCVGDYVLFLCIRAIWSFCNGWRWNLCSWKHGWGWWSSRWCEHGPFLQFVKYEKSLLAMQQLITIWWGALQTMEFQALLWKPHSRTFIC